LSQYISWRVQMTDPRQFSTCTRSPSARGASGSRKRQRDFSAESAGPESSNSTLFRYFPVAGTGARVRETTQASTATSNMNRPTPPPVPPFPNQSPSTSSAQDGHIPPSEIDRLLSEICGRSVHASNAHRLDTRSVHTPNLYNAASLAVAVQELQSVCIMHCQQLRDVLCNGLVPSLSAIFRRACTSHEDPLRSIQEVVRRCDSFQCAPFPLEAPDTNDLQAVFCELRRISSQHSDFLRRQLVDVILPLQHDITFTCIADDVWRMLETRLPEGVSPWPSRSAFLSELEQCFLSTYVSDDIVKTEPVSSASLGEDPQAPL